MISVRIGLIMAFNLAKLSARVNRARSQVGRGIIYKLGRGGFHPSAVSPATYDANSGMKMSDCSGFAAWVLGLNRAPKPGRDWWIETSAMWADARKSKSVFMAIERPVAGCLVVYPDTGITQGHVGVVTDVSFDHSGRITYLRVIDCASGPSRRTGQAITERDGSFFLKNPKCTFMVLREDVA